LYNNTASNTGSDQRHPLIVLQKTIQATEKWKVPSRIWHVSISSGNYDTTRTTFLASRICSPARGLHRLATTEQSGSCWKSWHTWHHWWIRSPLYLTCIRQRLHVLS